MGRYSRDDYFKITNASCLLVAEALGLVIDESKRSNAKAVHIKDSGGLYIFPEKNNWYRHSDGAKGFPADLVADTLGCSRDDALDFIANRVLHGVYIVQPETFVRKNLNRAAKSNSEFVVPPHDIKPSRVCAYLIRTRGIDKKSDFDLASFGTEPKRALFYVLPDERETFYPITTILVAQQYELLVVAAKKTGNRLRYRVNFVLDEFGNFSKIETFEKKLTVSRGYGIRWNLFLQSFAQLKLVYGEEVANIAKGNCRYWIYLQSTDIETNKELSEAMGKYTTLTYSLGSSAQKYSNPSSSVNVSLIERSLLTSEEIMNGFERPYSLVISNNSPAVMESPDISKWAFNDMLGLGDKKHNQRLIELDENARPSYDGEIEIKLWKPWLELAAKTRKAVNAENEGHNSMF